SPGPWSPAARASRARSPCRAKARASCCSLGAEATDAARVLLRGPSARGRSRFGTWLRPGYATGGSPRDGARRPHLERVTGEAFQVAELAVAPACVVVALEVVVAAVVGEDHAVGLHRLCDDLRLRREAADVVRRDQTDVEPHGRVLAAQVAGADAGGA